MKHISSPENVNRRKLKRYENKMMPDYPIYEAHCLGEWAAYYGSKRDRINPYPPGRRHDTWNRAFSQKD